MWRVVAEQLKNMSQKSETPIIDEALKSIVTRDGYEPTMSVELGRQIEKKLTAALERIEDLQTVIRSQERDLKEERERSAYHQRINAELLKAFNAKSNVTN